MATQCFHIPSVPRGLLLPGLDTYEVQDEELHDPTPAGSNWLFRPPPYISWADLSAEMVTIQNPSAWSGASLDGYTLSDRLQKHTFHFPAGCVVRARRSLTLYCCPGKLSEGALDNLPQTTAVLWKNQDGSLRRKEVMDNTGDALVLSDPLGKEISVLEVPGIDDNGEPEMKLAGVKRTQVLALRTLVLTLCYLRLASLGFAAARVNVNPDVFLLFAALAHVLDVLSRWASSQPGVSMDSFGVVLATMGDRLSALILLGSLAVLDGDARHSQIFAGMLALDITANWLQLSVASNTGKSLAGGAFVRGRGAAPDFPTHLMLRHPFALTLVSLGNEAFLVWSYLVASSSLPLGLRPGMVKASGLVSCWSSDALRLVSSFYSSFSSSSSSSSFLEGSSPPFLMSTAEISTAATEGGEDGGGFGGFEPSRINPAALGLEQGGLLTLGGAGEDGAAAGGAAVAWKAVWMALMVCCAVRQLLSCIQALISMSSLSSGVIADAGRDLQRRNPRPRRGRSTAVEIDGGYGGAGSGNGGSSSVSRARSRSRPR
ncbi:unnamed protein product [Pylaiella littoralis]